LQGGGTVQYGYACIQYSLHVRLPNLYGVSGLRKVTSRQRAGHAGQGMLGRHVTDGTPLQALHPGTLHKYTVLRIMPDLPITPIGIEHLSLSLTL
jgi:hypothetical protein